MKTINFKNIIDNIKKIFYKEKNKYLVIDNDTKYNDVLKFLLPDKYEEIIELDRKSKEMYDQIDDHVSKFRETRKEIINKKYNIDNKVKRLVV